MPFFSKISMLNTWFTDGGGYVDQFDNWVSTGSYKCRAYVWEGEQCDYHEGYQPHNRVTLSFHAYRMGRGKWFACGINIGYRGSSGLDLKIEGESGVRARSLAQLQRKILWRWRTYGSVAAVISDAYDKARRGEVFKILEDGTLMPFASTWYGLGGVHSPGTPLGYGEFLICYSRDDVQSLSVNYYGTGGSVGDKKLLSLAAAHWLY